MSAYGVVDLGSNTVRLVVYEVDGKRKRGPRRFRELVDDKVMAGLAAHVADGVFQPSGIKRAASVVRRHLRLASILGCERVDVFATAVLRNCENSEQAVEALQRRVQVPVHLLSARDEAHLGFVGATIDRPAADATLVDMGGGSTELVRVEDGLDVEEVSLGQGSLSSYATHVSRVLPTPGEVEAIQDELSRRLRTLPDFDRYRARHLLAIGGSVRAIAKVLAELRGEARTKTLSRDDVEEVLDLLRRDPDAFAHATVRCVPVRIHTVGTGCAMYARLMDELGAEDIEIRQHGVREGYLVERMLG